MIPIVDMHCHLLAGMDDGPRTGEVALAMCRMAYEEEGVRMVAALAHQNEHYSSVTPDGIRLAVQKLAQALHQAGLQLMVIPCAEVMAHPDLNQSWKKGDLLSVGDHKQYLLVEMPDGLFVDLRHIVGELREAGIRPILAHPERHAELLHEPGTIEELIEMGCLVQVSSGSVTDPPSRADARALKSWFKRGVVHLIGSDGHSLNRRPPRCKAAYEIIFRWAGGAAADRICSTNGMAILQGWALRTPEPQRKRIGWFSKLF